MLQLFTSNYIKTKAKNSPDMWSNNVLVSAERSMQYICAYLTPDEISRSKSTNFAFTAHNNLYSLGIQSTQSTWSTQKRALFLTVMHFSLFYHGIRCWAVEEAKLVKEVWFLVCFSFCSTANSWYFFLLIF